MPQEIGKQGENPESEQLQSEQSQLEGPQSGCSQGKQPQDGRSQSESSQGESLQSTGSRGAFITFEGGDGAGKSTHIKFLARALEQCGYSVVRLREPGGTQAGEALRQVVLDPSYEGLSAESELLIYEAARAQLVKEVIAPALAAGKIVLCDRFCDSTIAYQAYGRGLSRDFVQEANLFACQGIKPDRTVLIKAPTSARKQLERATRAQGPDRIELAGVEFHTRVREAFDAIAASDPDRVRVVVSASRKSETARLVFAAVADCVGWDANKLPFDEHFFEQANKIHGASRRKRGRQS
ncbi:thymidylate kinase [Cryptobacterium curtum DSM 15641]|uniref:Thymidylate kinase n=1 Tax=Cryptobacterium curtum (strain ATCC 700683 / DSM 15641 / CCUG 43107 / 12-3) TaxID=469378 RepID=C7MNX9_CRYCD|nr:dTMP kinase [Cryptobacterium curtum]ACU94619.1 thymidylate kinase [Cryptobacterium curtum DSM 15641]